MRRDDLVYVAHMADRIAQVRAKVAGLSRDEFDADENLRLAVTHLVQDVGEAAARLSAAFRARHPDVPWRQIIGMRHRIVHDYLDVDFDIVWDVSTADFPALLAVLQALARPAHPD